MHFLPESYIFADLDIAALIMFRVGSTSLTQSSCDLTHSWRNCSLAQLWVLSQEGISSFPCLDRFVETSRGCLTRCKSLELRFPPVVQKVDSALITLPSCISRNICPRDLVGHNRFSSFLLAPCHVHC